MLRSALEIRGYTILASDGEIGKVADLVFEDDDWSVRYVVVDTGTWLPGRKVLLPPAAFGQFDWAAGRVPVEMSKEQIENSPPLDNDAPISRQYEKELYKYWGIPPYWSGPAAAGSVAARPVTAQKRGSEDEAPEPEVDESTVHANLRSCKEVKGYHIEATDDEIGHVEDFIVDVASWTIRYFVVDTRNWLPGRKVILPPIWAKKISWPDAKVYMDVSRETIKTSPEFDPSRPINREYEEVLYDYYGRPKYWGN